MSFLERAIRNGIRRGIGDAVGKAVQKAVEPKATELVNQAADRIDKHNAQNASDPRPSGGLEAALGNLERSVQGYATEAAKNTKVCPNCGRPSSAEVKFCPGCGSKLPEETLAQGALCPSCGKQNPLGTKFCSDCGTMLPAAAAEEEKSARQRAEIMRRWDAELPGFPRWSFGGSDYCIEKIDGEYYSFSASYNGDPNAAYQALENYRELAAKWGFAPAGQYPSRDQLYRKVDGVCYHIDLEHCFDGDSDCPTLGFDLYEPTGGFDYVKPEPKKSGFLNLFK